MRYRTAALVLLLLAAPLNVVSAQSYSIQGIDSYLRVEFQPGSGRRGPVVTGYVHNVTGYTADRVRLAIETVDASGQVKQSSIAAVLGTVPPYGRAYFEFPVKDAGPHRVRVLSFDPVGRGA